MIKIPFRPTVLAAAIVLSVGTGTSTPVMAAISTLANASNGQAILATVGDTIKVQLTSEQGRGLKWTWGRLATSDPNVVSPSGSAMRPDGSTSGSFEVQDPGTATITAVESCTATTPDAQCPNTVKTWTVAVNAAGT